MEILWFVVKVVGGTCLFTLILWYVQQKHPHAAGMLLTFPALNGIGLLTAESPDVFRMASAMIPMIATNGLLCAGYIILHRRLATVLSALPVLTQVVGILSAGLGVWVGVAYGVMPHLPLYTPQHVAVLILTYGFSIWPLTAWLLWCPVQAPPPNQQGFWGVLRTNPEKIGGVFVLLSLVLLATQWGAVTWAGRLSALPLLPLYSLAMIPATLPEPQQRIRQLDQLGSTVLLGPLVAMAFVVGFGSYLGFLKQHTNGVWYWGCGLLGLVVGWSLCGGAIGMVVLLGYTQVLQQRSGSCEKR